MTPARRKNNMPPTQEVAGQDLSWDWGGWGRGEGVPYLNKIGLLSYLSIYLSIYHFYFYGHNRGIWKFPGPGIESKLQMQLELLQLNS